MEESTNKPIPAFPDENKKVKKYIVIFLLVVVTAIFLTIII
jgi:hypothetical protein